MGAAQDSFLLLTFSSSQGSGQVATGACQDSWADSSGGGGGDWQRGLTDWSTALQGGRMGMGLLPLRDGSGQGSGCCLRSHVHCSPVQRRLHALKSRAGQEPVWKHSGASAGISGLQCHPPLLPPLLLLGSVHNRSLVPVKPPDLAIGNVGVKFKLVHQG